MPWVKLDDNFPQHPKVLAAGPRAAWVHLCAIAHCARNLTDGHISPAVAKSVGATKPVVVALVEAQLWEENGNGWVIHDYLAYQPSRKQVEETRRMKAEAGRKGGSKP